MIEKKYRRLTVNIEPDLYTELKVKAAKENTTIQKLVSDFVKEYTKKKED